MRLAEKEMGFVLDLTIQTEDMPPAKKNNGIVESAP